MPLGDNKTLQILEEALQAAKTNTNIDALLFALHNLKDKLPGFNFRITTAEGSSEVTSFVFQTGNMRRRLALYGDVCFLDASHSTNAVVLVSLLLYYCYFIGRICYVPAVYVRLER